MITASTKVVTAPLILSSIGLGGNIQQVQNILGKILDYIESSINALNFTVSIVRAEFRPATNIKYSLWFLHFQDPFKSSLLFVALCALSIILIVIPTRYIALLGILVRKYREFLVRR